MGLYTSSRRIGLDAAAPAFALLALTLACTGEIGASGIEPSVPPISQPNGPASADQQAASTAIPRLSRREIEATVRALFAVEGRALALLPPDPPAAIQPSTGGHEEVFDTFVGTYTTYLPSEPFVQGQAALAFDLAEQVSADPSRIAELGGCSEPSTDCLNAFIMGAGRRIFRRPLNSVEQASLEEMAQAFLPEGFPTAVRAVLMALLQSPEFVYRVSPGDAEGTLRRLDNYELLSRLTYHFWGGPPDAPWLDRAEGGPWSDETLSDIVEEIAQDPRAEGQLRALHAAWIGHERLLVADPELARDMMQESDALLERALAEGQRWSGLFTSEETFVTPALAAHYGMEAVGAVQWVRYTNDERAGILSHGAFLSLSSTRGEGTLPSRRGAILAERILCSPIPPPPPDVDIDDGVEVAEGACKVDGYAAHRQQGSSCESCHRRMDPIGFGFERFDGLGQYRTRERENEACEIAAEGMAAGQRFSGPREFVELIHGSGDLTACGTSQMMRFALRRGLHAEDTQTHARLHDAFVNSGENFRALMVALALDPTFRYRKERP